MKTRTLLFTVFLFFNIICNAQFRTREQIIYQQLEDGVIDQETADEYLNPNKVTINNIKFDTIKYDNVKSKILSNNFTMQFINWNCYSIEKGKQYNVISLIKNDVIGYYGLNEKYNTKLKRNLFGESLKCKELNAKLNEDKRIFLKLCYYTYVDEFKMSDYSIEKGKFTINFPEHVKQHGEDEIAYRPVNCFNSSKLYISFPTIPIIKSVLERKNYGDWEYYRFHTKLNIDVNKINALEIENNKDKLRIYFIILDNIKKGNIFNDNFETWVGPKYKSEINDYYFANKVRMVIANKETGEIYFSKLYVPAAPKKK